MLSFIVKSHDMLVSIEGTLWGNADRPITSSWLTLIGSFSLVAVSMLLHSRPKHVEEWRLGLVDFEHAQRMVVVSTLK